MNNLRSALSKEAEDQVSVSRTGSGKPFPKAKNASIWAIDPEQEQQNRNQGKEKLQHLLTHLHKQLQLVHKKDSTFSEMSFYEIMESIQGSSEGMQQLQCLQFIQDNGYRAAHFQEQSFQEFVEGFYEYLNRRIKKLRKKEKKNELQEYEKIVKTNFKKKGAVQFIDQDNLDKAKPEGLSHQVKKISSHDGSKNQGSASKLNGSNSSTEGNKLGQLLTNSKLKEQKSHHSDHNQASVTFSAIVSQNMTVRQRETRQKKKEKKEHQQSQQDKQKPQGNSNNDAFIFYRPKAGKTK